MILSESERSSHSGLWRGWDRKPRGVPPESLGLISRPWALSAAWFGCSALLLPSFLSPSSFSLSPHLSPLPCFLLNFITKCTYTECIKHVCKVTTCIFVWSLPRVRAPLSPAVPRGNFPLLPPSSVLLFLLHFLLVSLPSLGSLNTVLFHLASFELYLKDRIVCNSLWPWFKKISGSQLRGIKKKV